MYKETPLSAERMEIDPALRSRWPGHVRSHTESGSLQLYRQLGRLALDATIASTNNIIALRPYLRSNDRLDADDIRDLESYFEFLRHQYGMPEGATVFPKRDTVPSIPAEEEGDDADDAA
jgi:hypothetical protein